MKRLFILFALCLGVLSVACESDNGGSATKLVVDSATEVTLGMYDTQFVVEYHVDGGSAQADVNVTASWLRVAKHEDGVVTVNVEVNETGGDRMAAVILSSGSSTQSVVVSQSGEPTLAVITIEEEICEIERSGRVVEIAYTLENTNPVDYVYVKTSAKWIYSIDTTTTEGVIALGVATNTTDEARETTVTIGYGNSTASCTLRQSGSGDFEFEAPMLTGDYLGDALTPGSDNYYMFLTDRGFDEEGVAYPNATYYRIDAYAPAHGSTAAYVPIPEGTYTFDAEDSLEPWTFTTEYSGFWVTDEEGKRGPIAKFESGTMLVEAMRITLDVVIDGEQHHVVYNGVPELVDNQGEVTVYSTLDGDYEADLSNHTFIYECYGDYYDFGYTNWMFLLLPNDDEGDCFQLDFITGYADVEDGFYGSYTASDYLAQWSFIPGWTNMQQLLCSWYFTVDQSEVAPFRSGNMSITDNGDGTITVNIDVYDDLRNNITGTWTGVPQAYTGE